MPRDWQGKGRTVKERWMDNRIKRGHSERWKRIIWVVVGCYIMTNEPIRGQEALLHSVVRKQSSYIISHTQLSIPAHRRGAAGDGQSDTAGKNKKLTSDLHVLLLPFIFHLSVLRYISSPSFPLSIHTNLSPPWSFILIYLSLFHAHSSFSFLPQKMFAFFSFPCSWSFLFSFILWFNNSYTNRKK